MIPRSVVAFCLTLGLAREAAAQEIEVRFDIDPSRAEQYGIDPAALQGRLDAELRTQLRFAEIGHFMDAMADAAAVSSKGMGVDYASNVRSFVVGAAVGSGAQDSGVRIGRGSDALPVAGFAAQLSLMAGFNLGALAGADEGDFSRRVIVYLNGMSLRMPGSAPFVGSMHQFGAHAQVHLLEPVRRGFAEWGGLAITAGYERSRYELELTRPLPIGADVQDARVTWNAGGTYTLASTVDAVPIEVSTNARFTFLTVFAGGGVDLQVGRSRASATLSGPVTARIDDDDVLLGNASVAGRAGGLADDLVPRAFGGVQVELLALKLYGQLNVAGNGAVGGHTGVRLAF